MAKPRLGKVRALFYVFQHEKEAAPILTQPQSIPRKITGTDTYPWAFLIRKKRPSSPFHLVQYLVISQIFRNFAATLRRGCLLETSECGRSLHNEKRLLALDSWLSEMWQFLKVLARMKQQ